MVRAYGDLSPNTNEDEGTQILLHGGKIGLRVGQDVSALMDESYRLQVSVSWQADKTPRSVAKGFQEDIISGSIVYLGL